MEKIKIGDNIKVYFPGESMWVEVLSLPVHGVFIGKLLNTPFRTIMEEAFKNNKETPEQLRIAYYQSEKLHDVKNFGELVVVGRNEECVWVYLNKCEAHY